MTERRIPTTKKNTEAKKSASRSKRVMASDLPTKSDSPPEVVDQTTRDAHQEIASENILNLGSALTIRDVVEWRDKMMQALDVPGGVKIDAGDLEQIDGAGLQLLVSFVKEADARSCDLVWLGASDNLRQGISILGLNAVIKIET
ncbi:MAG: STAS domain-containing protein [Gammaproteobacteria bacterium]|nr:STAS domain-containing protein [Gammaproteobacteria bacterium]